MLNTSNDYIRILIKITLSVILGGLIGLEREFKNRPAGFRTHILVCIGSTTIMILSELLFARYYYSYQITADPARLAAQVISGIGFLGAGTIIHNGANIKGLTTAASLWVVAAIGLTIGAGYYFLSITVFIAITGVLALFGRYSHMFNETGRILELIIQIVNKPKAIGEISLLLGKIRAEILDMIFLSVSDNVTEGEKETAMLKITIKLSDETNFYEVMQKIQAINGVINIERV